MPKLYLCLCVNDRDSVVANHTVVGNGRGFYTGAGVCYETQVNVLN